MNNDNLAIQPNFNRAVSIDVVRFEQNRLVFDRPLDADETIKMVKFVKQCDDATRFWQGDLINHVHENRGEEAARETARQFEDPSLAWESFRTVAALQNRYLVTFKSHRSALDECRGDAVQADYWLREAEKNGWAPEVLRANIRRSHSGTVDNQNDKGSPTLTSMIRKLGGAISGTIKDRPIEAWSLEEVSGVLSDLEPLLEVHRVIKRRWSEFNPMFKM